MPRLPALSGREVVRGLQRLGFEQVGQRGSHIKMRRGGATVIIPDHREVRRGTLSSILKLASVLADDLLEAISH